MAITGKSEIRVDAFDKATGRTKYYDDLAPSDALIVRVKHSTIAHGFVKSVDTSAAARPISASSAAILDKGALSEKDKNSGQNCICPLFFQEFSVFRSLVSSVTMHQSPARPTSA